MSTIDRYFGIVCEAIKDFDRDAIEAGTTYWFTVGDIAKRAGVSHPTARKYINALVSQEFVHRAGVKQMPIFAVMKGVD